ncbi:sensor histidine kinase [Sediminibacillus halophilus]|uniref:histidine kinase n=1 Tax=Sediminibacillus halophilus TaxID=482461 RepID=A0A1G9TBV2_9BACI|nr:sensor histidine kinase [Sediminibacillus halophilus]SDM45173.1 two-component system, OmpR family, bacitracin resistance sensor histidine kinase BceS [Sediminibacillus halophilus]
MIISFLRERLSWIILYLFIQLLALLIGFLDEAIRFSSIIYFVFLSLIVFVIFLIVRYQRETKFFQELADREYDLDVTSLPDPKTPFQRLIIDSIVIPIEQLKKDASTNQQLLEQEKDDLLSWIHEVKTPMTTMHLIIDRINDQQLKSQLKNEWLRIHLLLDQQLHQKRIPFIENDLYMETIELEPLLFNEINSLRSWCMQKRIGIDVDLSVSTVLSDAKWLSFIIRQLLTNAIKYSEVSSEIMVKSGQKDGQDQLQIIDNGRGIEAKDLPRIFDRGFTSTTKHQDNAATGMGLYLSKIAADILKMDLRVQSEPGEGATFTLTFPDPDEFVKIRGM